MKISHAEVYGQLSRAPLTQHLGGSRGRSHDSSEAQRQRAVKRRLQELNQENYKDTKMEIPPTFIKGGLRPGKTANSRRVLASKKTIANVFDDDPSGAEAYFTLHGSASRYPSRPRCLVCGYFSAIACMKCGGKLCSRKCDRMHLERCQSS